MKQTTNVSQEVKVQVPNIAVSINDISLDTRSRNDEVSQIFKTSDDDDTARLLIRTNFTSFKNRITPSNEYNKTDYGYNINGTNKFFKVLNFTVFITKVIKQRLRQ